MLLNLANMSPSQGSKKKKHGEKTTYFTNHHMMYHDWLNSIGDFGGLVSSEKETLKKLDQVGIEL